MEWGRIRLGVMIDIEGPLSYFIISIIGGVHIGARFGMVWLYRSLILVLMKGKFYLFKWFLPALTAPGGKGGGSKHPVGRPSFQIFNDDLCLDLLFLISPWYVPSSLRICLKSRVGCSSSTPGVGKVQRLWACWYIFRNLYVKKGRMHFSLFFHLSLERTGSVKIFSLKFELFFKKNLLSNIKNSSSWFQNPSKRNHPEKFLQMSTQNLKIKFKLKMQL